MIRTPMGPGFFIFFPLYHKGGGASGRLKAFAGGRLGSKVTKKLKRKLAYYRKQEVDEILTPVVVSRVKESMRNDAELGKIIHKYEIDPVIAQARIDDYVDQYLWQIQDEELALLLILANI